MTLAAACKKDSGAERQPRKTEFVRRVLPDGIVPGYRLPGDLEAVDLGLSVKWAPVNIGAAAPAERGDYFAWGEISASGNYGWASYEFNKAGDASGRLNLTKYCFDNLGEINDVAAGSCLDMLDDPAYIAWGEGWSTPTAAQFEELAEKCSWTYDMKAKTFRVTGSNGNFIIMPVPGYAVGESISGPGESQAYLESGYWTSELSDYSSADARMVTMTVSGTGDFSIEVNKGHNRCFGHPVRAVME